MRFTTKEEHEAWLKERDSYDGDFVMPKLELEVNLGVSEYYQIRREPWSKIHPLESKLRLYSLGDFWIVEYWRENHKESVEHYKTREAALFEMDRIMDWGDYDERTLVHCGRCEAVYEWDNVANICPMCGADHNGKDFDKYLGWTIWHFHPADYAGAMYHYWKKHLEWRKKNNLEYPDWVDGEGAEDDADN